VVLVPPGSGGASGSGGSVIDSGGSGGTGGEAGTGGMGGMIVPPADADPSKLCSLGTPITGAILPAGFCARVYAKVPEARTLALAPNGDIFVGAPSQPTPGGSSDGPGAIVVLYDDNHDGKAEQQKFLDGVSDVHGLAIGGGFLYFTTQSDVWRTPYTSGQRKETGPRESLHMPAAFGGGGRWTHGLARSVGGQLLVSRGEYAACGKMPGGEITRIDTGTPTTLARAFRNPMYMRCHSADDICGAAELGEDLAMGAVEKFILIKPNTNYGFPCCFATNQPTNDPSAGPCSDVTPHEASFTLSETPFGFDWERGLWPEPYRSGIFVALHGSAYASPQWKGARVVFAPSNSMTHAPVGDWRGFLEGFAGSAPVLKRPSDIVFSPDGRMFVADDQGGNVYWIAPESLPLNP
jgi:glucose/arabinose dehydrogenase